MALATYLQTADEKSTQSIGYILLQSTAVTYQDDANKQLLLYHGQTTYSYSLATRDKQTLTDSLLKQLQVLAKTYGLPTASQDVYLLEDKPVFAITVPEATRREKETPSFVDPLDSSSADAKQQTTKDQFDIKETETIIAFKQKLTALMKHEDGSFAFQIKRTKYNCLQLQFIAADTILMTIDDIRKELIELTKLLKQAMLSLDVKAEQFKVEPNWKNWTLTITAEPNVLHQIGTLLHHAGANYFQSAPQAQALLFSAASDETTDLDLETPSSKLEVPCLVQ